MGQKLLFENVIFRLKSSKVKTVKKSFSKTAKHEFNFLSNHHFPSFSSSSAAELQPPRLALTNFIFGYLQWWKWKFHISWLFMIFVNLFSRFWKKSLENLFYFFLNADDSLFFLTPPRAIRNCSWVFPFSPTIFIA